MQKDVLILAQSKGRQIDSITPQLIVKGRDLSDKLGGKLIALLLGYQLSAVAETLSASGVDEVVVVDHAGLEPYNPEIYLGAIVDTVKCVGPGLFLLGHTFLGMELGPAISTRLGVPLVSNCVDVELSQQKVIVTRPMYGGIVHTKMAVDGPSPIMVSIQKGAFPASALPARPARISNVHVDIKQGDIRTKVVGMLEPPEGKIDITKADIIVSIGRGLRDKANLGLVEKVATALGGVVACSRPLADLGWLPIECHVGISGKTVKPKVYLACGISGAAQHIAGMKDCQLIIAINKDVGAPIFRVAHYGVVGDLFEVLPALIQQASLSQAEGTSP